MLIRIQLKAVLIAACVAVSLVVAAGLHWNARTQSASAEFESVNQLMRGINTLRVISAESVYLSTPLALDQWQRQAKKLQLELQSLGDESRLHRAEFEAMASRLATVQSDFLRQAGQLGGATSAVPPTHPDKPEGIALSQRDRLVVTLLALTDELADSGRTLLAAELHDLRVAEKRLMQTALLLLLVLLGVLVFVWRLVRTEVLRPLLELSMGVQQVTAGDYSTRLRFSGSSEFGQLALSFDAMRERLQASLVQSSADADRRAGNAETVGDALREAQALLTTLNLHSIVSVADRAGRIIEVNDAFCTISGYSRAELIGNNHRIVNSSEQAREFWVEMWADISSGKPWRREVCNRAKNGTLYWVDTLVAPLLGADGRVEKYISIRTDISRSKADALKLLGSLSDSQALLSTLHQHSIVSVADRAGRISEVNDAFCAISGYSRAELIGNNHRIVNSGEQALEFWVEMWADISSGKPWRREVCNRAKNGTLYWVDTLVAPLLGVDGRVEKFISIRTDISRSKADALKLQGSLSDSQALLSTLHQHSIVSVADRAGRITEVNDAFCAISGYSREELIGSNHRVVNSGEQADEFWVEMWDEISSGRPWRREVCNRAKNGSLYWVDTLVAPLQGADGLVEKFISIRTDISRSKADALKLRTALREGQALLNTLHLHAIVSVADRAGRITEVNDAFCGISGFSRAELIGANHRIVNSGQQSSEFWVEMWDDISNGRPWRREVCNRAKDGSFYWVDTVVAPLMGADGKVEKYISIRTDISAHKQAQLSLQAAKESADEANRSKSDFLANMSHELRTPMNAILGMLSLLLKTDLNKRQRDYSSKTQAAARSLLGLLNEILDFSKIEAGKMTLDPQPFRFDQLLRDLSVILAANLGAKKLEVLFDIDPALPRLLVGDAMRLQQVLINLSGNAIKFTAQGAVVLTVKVEQQHDAAVTLQIGVRDSGIGIAPENHARIFSGFSQAEASTTRRYGGTGLGVAISQRLVALMGGELQLQSALGEGSLFFFSLTLPLATAADLAQEAASERELAQASEPEQALALSAAEACGLCVLVVDDNPQAREVLGRMCAALGWAVDVAASGAEALQKIAAQAQAGQAYQALFIDWMMPDLDGWQTCQRVKALALSSPPLLIVMVSANDRELLAQRSPQEQAGLDGYLFKPVTRSMLWDAYMDARAAREPAQHAAKLLPAPVGRRLAGMRLLVVEDNPNNQQVAQELLEDEGATVQLAGNGQEGVDAIAASMSGPLAKPFDVVLMDLQMPVLDGLGASRKIRQELGLLTLPIVAMTANAMDSDRQACLAAGMNDHVGKPFELSALVKVLCRVSGRGLSPQQTPGDDAAGQPLAAELLALAGAAEVDLAVALHRIGGKRPVYQRMLRSFINDLAAMPAALIGHLEAAEFADAARLMHTLKGLAATLGMGPLSAQAAAAEKLVAGAEPLERKLVHACHLNQALLAAEAGLQGLHDGLLASIEAAAEAAVSRPEEASGKADLAEWRTGLHALSLHLQDADMAAMQDIEALSAQCRLLFGSTRPLQDLDEAVGSLDFERALTLCKALIEEAGP